ncbi:MAG: hypothetical protein ACPKM0_00760 [Pleomorphochaeta sp.]
MKKIAIILFLILFPIYGLFSASPNILINGYLGQDSPPTIILKVDSTEVINDGNVVSIVDNFNFTTNRTSYTQPIHVYAGYVSAPTSSNALFQLTVSTEGFKLKNDSDVFVGSPLDIDIQLFTETLDNTKGTIVVGAYNFDSYNENIYLDSASNPVTYIYSVSPNVSIDDSNYIIWFEWDEKENVAAGRYGALISFEIITI